MLTASYYYCQVVDENLRKVWRQWPWMLRILGQEGGDPRTSGKVYKVVVQATILFGAETSVMSPNMERTLGGFQHRVSFRLAKMQTMRDMTGRWLYPLMDEAMPTVGL